MGLFDGSAPSDGDERDDTADGWAVDESRDGESSADGNADAPAGPTLVAADLFDDQPNGTIKRVVDREAGVVLYCYKNQRAGGMAAVPISETELESAAE